MSKSKKSTIEIAVEELKEKLGRENIPPISSIREMAAKRIGPFWGYEQDINEYECDDLYLEYLYLINVSQRRVNQKENYHISISFETLKEFALDDKRDAIDNLPDPSSDTQAEAEKKIMAEENEFSEEEVIDPSEYTHRLDRAIEKLKETNLADILNESQLSLCVEILLNGGTVYNAAKKAGITKQVMGRKVNRIKDKLRIEFIDYMDGNVDEDILIHIEELKNKRKK